jgi:hypothetical protein
MPTAGKKRPQQPGSPAGKEGLPGNGSKSKKSKGSGSGSVGKTTPGNDNGSAHRRAATKDGHDRYEHHERWVKKQRVGLYGVCRTIFLIV